MRTSIALGTMFLASLALAQTQQLQIAHVVKLKFVPPEEMANRPNHPQASADGAYTATMTVQGVDAKTQKPWASSVSIRSYEIVSPRDAASGLPTGKRMHKPMVIHLEKQTNEPIASAIVKGDKVTSIVLTFKPVTSGPTHTIVMPNPGALKYMGAQADDSIMFTYQKISWTWNDGGKVQHDDWTDPNP